MKKSLIALAVLAAAGTAYAQSSVTLGGILKEGVGRTSLSNGVAAPAVGGFVAGTANGSNTAVIDGSSRLLVSGVEDLGGGTSAYFQMDTRFRLDDNGQNGAGLGANGTLAGGNTFVGLRGGWGSAQLGRLDTHYCTSVNDDIAGNGTAIALQASSCALQGYVNGSTGARSIAVASRSTNVLRYTTPNMSGFTGMFTYSWNPYGVERPATITTGQAGSAYALGLNYDQGPLAVRFSYWNHKTTTNSVAGPAAAGLGAEAFASGGAAAAPAGAAAPSQRAWLIGAGYDFGVAKVGLTYDRSALRDLGPGIGAAPFTGGGSATRNVWIVPVTVPLGTGQLIASYARATAVKLDVGGTLAGTDAKLFSLGYNYPLSKRTSLGAVWSRLNNGAAGAYQLYTNGSLGNSGAVTGVPPGTDQTLIYLGMRHVF